MMPCPNRDHHEELRRLLAIHEPDPIDDNAFDAMLDPTYAKGLAEYDAAYEKLSQDIWDELYLRPSA